MSKFLLNSVYLIVEDIFRQERDILEQLKEERRAFLETSEPEKVRNWDHKDWKRADPDMWRYHYTLDTLDALQDEIYRKFERLKSMDDSE